MSSKKEKLVELNNLYVHCMNCQMDCKNVMKDLSGGIPPRGFYFKNFPVKILIVGKNPGHPLENESKRYKGKNR
jgi:uracil-DNA glycosylase